MTRTFEVNLQLTDDGPDCMEFEDTYQGLENIWYHVRVGDHGGVSILANPDGFEHLARVFLKLARTEKSVGYHSHHPLEFGADHIEAWRRGKELTIGITNAPA